jgi:hypothetical protein
MLAAIIAASISGAHVNVKQTYNYFNRPENELWDTGAQTPPSVTTYLMDQGFEINSADSSFVKPNGVYITYYPWQTTNQNGWHYQCITTDAIGGITGYNSYNSAPYASVDDLRADHNGIFIVGFFEVYKLY